MEGKIHIVRDGLELGILPATDARELLASGFLLPTDTYSTDVDNEVKALPELLTADAEEPLRVASKVSALVRATADVVRRNAAKTAAGLSATVRRSEGAMTAATSRFLLDSLPRLQSSVTAAFAKSTESIDSALRNEPFLTKLFGAAYDTLPRSVHRFVNEETFISFCMKHRERLLRKKSDL